MEAKVSENGELADIRNHWNVLKGDTLDDARKGMEGLLTQRAGHAENSEKSFEKGLKFEYDKDKKEFKLVSKTEDGSDTGAETTAITPKNEFTRDGMIDGEVKIDRIKVDSKETTFGRYIKKDDTQKDTPFVFVVEQIDENGNQIDFVEPVTKGYKTLE
jgi:hypothetical protein